MWRVTRTLVGVVAAIVVVAWLLLSVKHVPAYPPPPDALSPTAPRELVEQIAVEERVSTTDLLIHAAQKRLEILQGWL
jgi:hypothetical protein